MHACLFCLFFVLQVPKFVSLLFQQSTAIPSRRSKGGKERSRMRLERLSWCWSRIKLIWWTMPKFSRKSKIEGRYSLQLSASEIMAHSEQEVLDQFPLGPRKLAEYLLVLTLWCLMQSRRIQYLGPCLGYFSNIQKRSWGVGQTIEDQVLSHVCEGWLQCEWRWVCEVHAQVA